MRLLPKFGVAIVIFFVSVLTTIHDTRAEPFSKEVEKPVDESISIRQGTQREIEKWVGEKSDLEIEFEKLSKQNENLSAAIENLSAQTASRERNIDSLREQIDSMEKISRDLFPFLEAVYDRLQTLPEKPPPFLMQERTARLRGLRQSLDDPQVSLGEKFRKVMEALFVEAEYGNTVEVRQEKIRIGEESVLATVFRLGNMALFFETLDEERVGYFDLGLNKWTPLAKKANREIRAAIEITSKMRPAEIVNLPLGRIVVE